VPDRTIQCVDCGSDFVFTDREQEWYREKGLTHEPRRCKSCRSQRKTPGPHESGGPHRAHGAPSGSGGGGSAGPQGGDPGRGGGPGHGGDSGHGGGSGDGGSGDAPDPAGHGASPDGSPGDAPGGHEGAPPRPDRPRRPPPRPRELFKVACSSCGKETEVPFRPDLSRPVYCRDCYVARGKKR